MEEEKDILDVFAEKHGLTRAVWPTELIELLEKNEDAEIKDIDLYKKDDCSFIEPLPDCVDTIRKLNEYYEVYIVTAYIWKEDVIDASNNLKCKHEYLKHFFPFLSENNFIYISKIIYF